MAEVGGAAGGGEPDPGAGPTEGLGPFLKEYVAGVGEEFELLGEQRGRDAEGFFEDAELEIGGGGECGGDPEAGRDVDQLIEPGLDGVPAHSRS